MAINIKSIICKIINHFKPCVLNTNNNIVFIYDIIIEAENIYYDSLKNDKHIGLCYCFYKAIDKYNLHIYPIEKIIPEYIRINQKLGCYTHGYWWDINDIESRIHCLNYLKSIYKNSNKFIKNESFCK